ncbi:uroporphyrinogen decarboxylase family protein [Fontisphaera persica]|uniref:uroporphyrinogen decarboxylase family protein n=1 Tax=Fontisphaera persica TaxID=2974023 RepID=UPI0024BF844C|nr:uroporphyrinogen decarboxylase family protein [Fontisphaera persica]WCJ58524.1 uroporphyrinogen decarboxylase family protein [Fontisphaera persica]
MTAVQWEILCRCARGEVLPHVPVALIVDSPWIPGYLGLSTLDYLFAPDVWLDANLRVIREFPDLIFLPGCWAEIGMGAEPSAFGCKTLFYPDKTPQVLPLAETWEALPELAEPNPETDGFLPYLLTLYRRARPKLAEAGHDVRMVAARGPLTLATHLVGVSEFLMGIKTDPEKAHRLLQTLSRFIIHWLEAQAAAAGPAVQGIMVLDDITGFLSPRDFQTFALPYLQQIFRAFPEALKIFHNDTNNVVPYPFLREIPVDIFNFTHLQPLNRVRELCGPDICLMGNIPPLDVLAQGAPEQVAQAVAAARASLPDPRRWLLSAGGGVSPGTPGANLQALAQAAARL